MDSHDRKAGASELEPPNHPVPTPGPGQSPVPSDSRHTGRTALCPNVFSTGSGPKPSHHVHREFWWWDHYSLPIHMSTFLGIAYWRSGSGPPKDSNSGAAD